MLSVDEWSSRFQQQAGWTIAIRNHLYSKLNIPASGRILEVGCGTGAITRELAGQFSAKICGIDLALDFLACANRQDPLTGYVCGDAYKLPFPSRTFDLLVCHYFLMWVSNVPAIIAEMRRVTKNQGSILALAEPDYGGRIDYPQPLIELGKWQTFALRQQGADPQLGRRLQVEFLDAGLSEVSGGILGGEWTAQDNRSALASEWQMIEADLKGLLPAARLKELRSIDESACQSGTRVLFVPTFFATGKNSIENRPSHKVD